MPTLPAPMIAVLRAFAPLFSARVWRHAQVLLVGAILAPAQRTVAAALRVTGPAQVRQFHRYHRVLSRAVWSGLAVEPRAAGPAGRRLRADRAAARRHRRDLGAAPRQADRRQGHLPRPGALQPQPLRQSQRAALGLPDAAGADPLGRPHVGAAVPDGAGPLRAVRPRAGAAPQDADRLGAPVAARGAALVAGAGHRRRRRQHLRRAGVPRRLPRLAQRRSRSSPACASTPRSTSRPRPAAPARSAARA